MISACLLPIQNSNNSNSNNSSNEINEINEIKYETRPRIRAMSHGSMKHAEKSPIRYKLDQFYECISPTRQQKKGKESKTIASLSTHTNNNNRQTDRRTDGQTDRQEKKKKPKRGAGVLRECWFESNQLSRSTRHDNSSLIDR